LRWRAHVPPYLPPVRADTTRLQQILLNLLDNAMKFTLHGEVTLLAAAQQREVLLAVSDTGLGIPQADQSIIFDEFRQSERTSARGYGGMGLGLAITRRLVELHGGAMGLISSGEEGRGATFYFTLPIAEAEAPQGVPAARPQAGEHADTDAVAVANVLAGTGFHETGSMRAATAILLIDDEVAALRVQAELIRRRLPEARVYEAAGGRQALDLMQRVTPDLVLLDLAMPDMDGFAVLNAMAEQAALHAVPVVIMTANPPDDAAIQQLTPHVAAIVSKGLLAADETLATIQRALASKSRSPDAQRIARRCLAYIHRHYARPLTRGELAQHSGVNARYLTYCLHQEIGMPPFEYLNRYRVLVAKRLLREGRGRIGDVALAAGFGGAPQFSRMFRKYTGMSPRAYAHTPQDR
jgi:AraC-like DNA-binding protein